MLRFVQVVRREEGVRSFINQRYRVTRVVAKYLGSDGELYRKPFEAKGEPMVPSEGSHEQLLAKKKQW